MLKSYQGSELHVKADNMLKYEYSLMQEHMKVNILKQYMEGELSKIEQDKTELLKEREKYLLLNEEERQLEEEKKNLDCQRLEIQNLIENLKRNLQHIPGTMLDFSLLSSMQQSNPFSVQEDLHARKQSSFAQTLTKLDFPFSQNLGRHHNHTGSIFENAIDKSPFFMHAFNNQSNASSDASISARIDRILQSFDKLGQLQANGDPRFSIEIVDFVQRKEANIEALSKIIKRECYFLDEEKRHIQEKIQLKPSLPGTISNKTSLGQQFRSVNESLTNLPQNQSLIEDYKSNEELTVDDEKKKLQSLQQNLSLQQDRYKQLNGSLKIEIERVQIQQQDVMEMERQINEEKLKMLIKFEKIKLAEDFYNKYHKDELICLEIEVSDQEVQDLVKTLYKPEKKRRDIKEKEQQQIIADVVFKLSKFCFSMKRMKTAMNASQDKQCEIRRFLLLWKITTVCLRQQQRRNREYFLSLSRGDLMKIGIKNQKDQNDQVDWFDAFWERKRSEYFNPRIDMNAEQVMLLREKLDQEIETFWKFRAVNVIKMIMLHTRRRARLLLAFGFQKYKYQTIKAKVAFILQAKENAFLNQENSQETIPVNLFRQLQSQPGFLILEDSNQSSLMDGARTVRIAQSSLGSAVEFNNLGTPKLPGLPSSNGHHFSLRAGNEDETRPLKMTETLETHNSQTYTGISDIIRSQQMSQNIKRNAIVTYLLMKKDARLQSSLKTVAFNRWMGFMRDLEMQTIKTQMKRFQDEMEKLKFQEQLLRTSFRLQKSELESKVSELINHCIGGSGFSHTDSTASIAQS